MNDAERRRMRALLDENAILVFAEPHLCGGDSRVEVNADKAVEHQKTVRDYPSDEEALSDFITIYYAFSHASFGHWHKKLVAAIKDKTGCDHEAAFDALGEVCEVVQKIHMDQHKRGYEAGFEDGKKKASASCRCAGSCRKTEQKSDAEFVATIAHDGQFRRDGVTPYIEHPRAVASRVGDDEKAQSVAWLHDVLEDTKMTAEHLVKMGIPTDVVEVVKLLTFDPYEQLYSEYIKRVKSDPVARRVKIADMLSNLSASPTEKQIREYVGALAELFDMKGREQSELADLRKQIKRLEMEKESRVTMAEVTSWLAHYRGRYRKLTLREWAERMRREEKLPDAEG